ncbi:peptide-methionine (S)-S-oxide reductase MsrA [Thalassotalea sp. LPB0316]|uniref:peptide-methionine (S)-S-oxide reductase MsrA n=1 Tax=Thalassotalea sp. LPB0316 TaxID=2769490 RepID=UPI001868910A|nr:peptide-methionine (S)-S-oxide reductase MsrA [Thalassotalea sp. LPB0316]QOL26968.1 peptide-methionine (S)-S-oxide reductase MsrA [Thalassotalea sp. LPB0316]
MAQEITLAGGCFWCIEAAYLSVKGIISAQSGYSGGETQNPSYKEVCSGNTGHAEVVKLSYDPTIISTREILEIFFALHDPTQLNRQGNDVGTQYRSAVFYHNDEQRVLAEQIITEITEDEIWQGDVVTQIEAAQTFYPAEQEHKDYFNNNPENQYCQMVVSPKLAKFKKTFASKLK